MALPLRDYTVWEPDPKAPDFVWAGTVTAASCTEALRIAKQKGFFCPAISKKEEKK